MILKGGSVEVSQVDASPSPRMNATNGVSPCVNSGSSSSSTSSTSREIPCQKEACVCEWRECECDYNY